jgi:hypothetical protein
MVSLSTPSFKTASIRDVSGEQATMSDLYFRTDLSAGEALLRVLAGAFRQGLQCGPLAGNRQQALVDRDIEFRRIDARGERHISIVLSVVPTLM